MIIYCGQQAAVKLDTTELSELIEQKTLSELYNILININDHTNNGLSLNMLDMLDIGDDNEYSDDDNCIDDESPDNGIILTEHIDIDGLIDEIFNKRNNLGDK